MNELILGIDTSNYKTSVAVTDTNNMIRCDFRKLLNVKQGERGLRQSAALFQHMENMPHLIKEAMACCQNGKIVGVSVSSRPRPIDCSYMPVFRAGINFGQSLAEALRIPYFEFSHQEGHIASIKQFSRFSKEKEILCWHLSGGTCELLLVKGEASDLTIDIIGGSRDISFGQVIDRVGVSMGMQFPAGDALDRLAFSSAAVSKGCLTPLKVDQAKFNLSGIDTQCRRAFERAPETRRILAKELFDRIADCIAAASEQAMKLTGVHKMIFGGGVSASRCIRDSLKTHFSNSDLDVDFGSKRLSSDNAVGISLLGGYQLWR